VMPDLASFGKIIGGGGPLSVVAGRAELLNLADPRKRGEANYAYFNGTLHGNPVAAAATMATLDELQKPGFYEKLNGATADFCREAQDIFNRRNIPALAFNSGSLWQFLFCKTPPQNYAEYAAGDLKSARRLDAAMLRRGNYMLPGVRRFISAVHAPDSLQKTLRDLDSVCKAW
ncbi:MAG: aminotransferase class III-fold pyridoxal phosphate-dependent enzyme, partial [Gammaproteobacteria bacterium]